MSVRKVEIRWWWYDGSLGILIGRVDICASSRGTNSWYCVLDQRIGDSGWPDQQNLNDDQIICIMCGTMDVQFHPLDLISETHDLKKVFLSNAGMIQSMVIDQEAAPILQAKILTFRVTQQAHKNLMPKRKRLQLLKTLKMV